MKLITLLIDLILFTSVFTACCATGLCMATERLVSGVVPVLVNNLHILIFGSTLLVYNTPRLLSNRYDPLISISNYRYIYWFFFSLGLLLAAVGLWNSSGLVLTTSVVLGVFAFAYYLPLLPFGDKRSLRDFGWLKIFVLAGVWTTATAILPIENLHKNLGDYSFEIILRLVFIFTLCVIFDIRDMQADREHNIRTLPHKVGLTNSYHLINTGLLLLVFLSVFQYLRYPVGERLAGALITAIVTKIVVEYLKRHPTERGYMGLADGVMLVYSALVLIP